MNAAGARHVPVATFVFLDFIHSFIGVLFSTVVGYIASTAEEDGFLLGAGCWLDGVGFPLVCWQM